VTEKPVTNPAVLALDTSVSVAHRRHTVVIPSLTEELTAGKVPVFILVAAQIKK
jgi:hypothetical protein